MSQINISKLTFSYEGTYENIFENVSFQIDTDWKLGFIGRNGRGKTTFLNLLQEKYSYQGTISTSVCFDYFPFEVKSKAFNTLDVIEEICPDYVYWELVRELSLLEVDEDLLYRPFETLSNGEQTKVLLATLFLKENNFLLIDEPTNHLDLHARDVVANYLKRKKGFILISHDKVVLDICVDHILSINKTNIEIVQGNFSSWYENKQRQDSFEYGENEKLKKEINRLEKASKEKAEWSNQTEKSKHSRFSKDTSGNSPDKGFIGHKSAKMMKRSKTIEHRQSNLINEKSKLLKNVETSQNLKITQLDYHSNNLISFKDVSIIYDNNEICNNVSFDITKGERIALFGKNGSGKSSIIKLICGEEIKYSGFISIGSGLKISYVPQDTSFLKGDLTEFARENCIDQNLFRAILDKLDFSKTQFDKPIESFSSGQKKKVLIAKSLCESAHLHIWDEPLNFIDIISRMQIEELILAFKPTILFVEHDKDFCEKIATKKVVL